MTQLHLPALPTWVHKRDNRLVPFELDKIARSLFAVTEALGHPDAFLARELADGVLPTSTDRDGRLHSDDHTDRRTCHQGRPRTGSAGPRQHLPITPDVAETPTALRRPQISRTVAVQFNTDDDLPSVLRTCTREYGLQAVFSRDLLAAAADGLISLQGVEAPLELAGCSRNSR